MKFCPECGTRIDEFGVAKSGMPTVTKASDNNRRVKMEEEKVVAEYSGIRYHNKEKPRISKLKTVGRKIFLTEDHFIFIGNIKGVGGWKDLIKTATIGPYLSEKGTTGKIKLSDLNDENSIVIPLKSIISCEKKRSLNYLNGFISLKYRTRNGQTKACSFVSSGTYTGVGKIADKTNELRQKIEEV